MGFSDSRNPPPWAVDSGVAGSPTGSAGEANSPRSASDWGAVRDTPSWGSSDEPPEQGGATVISMRTRRRVSPGRGRAVTMGEGDAQGSRRGGSGREATVAAASSADPHDAAREVALRLLTASPKTRSQLVDALRARNHDDEVIETVLDRLEEVGLIDDADLAATFVRTQQVRRGLSGRALSQQLKAKGVDSDTVRGALEALDPQVEEECARALAEKKLRSMHGLDRMVQTRRLMGMLARKGYGGELSRRVITEVLADSPEHQRD